jgi:hypothetical protein
MYPKLSQAQTNTTTDKKNTQNKSTTRRRMPPRRHPTNINHQNSLDATEQRQKERNVALTRLLG